MAFFTISTPKGLRTIGPGNPCFIVAEMSGNHHQKYEKAVEIVKAAAATGADAIKLQTYTPDTITMDSKKPWFMEHNGENPSVWQGKSMYELYQSAYTPWEWHAPLKALAESLGLVFFSAPFDVTAVDYLEDLHVPIYKIASYEATDHVLLRKIAATGKPVIMSVGYATREEVDESVALLRKNGVQNLALLHCITYYAKEPDPAQAYLSTMLDLRDRYHVVCGFSDNDGGIDLPVLSAGMGASIIEKHLIIDNEEGGPDAQFSLDAHAFASMVQAVRRAEEDALHGRQPQDFFSWAATAMGSPLYGPRTLQERSNLRFRRSLFVVKDIKKGEIFTADTIRSIRPSDGLETKYYWDVLGKRALRDIERGTPLAWEFIERTL
jgi:pseudaminic acid synthase